MHCAIESTVYDIGDDPLSACVSTEVGPLFQTPCVPIQNIRHVTVNNLFPGLNI